MNRSFSDYALLLQRRLTFSPLLAALAALAPLRPTAPPVWGARVSFHGGCKHLLARLLDLYQLLRMPSERDRSSDLLAAEDSQARRSPLLCLHHYYRHQSRPLKRRSNGNVGRRLQGASMCAKLKCAEAFASGHAAFTKLRNTRPLLQDGPALVHRRSERASEASCFMNSNSLPACTSSLGESGRVSE